MATESGSSQKLWSGRFDKTTDRLVEAYTASVHVDRRLAVQDIRGSMAHARMLGEQGVLPPDDVEAIVSGLDQILAEVNSGAFVWRDELEDVHMNIESRLTELIGDAGKKLHTGRSRNDQVALDFRLYVDEALKRWQDGLEELVAVLVRRAEEHRRTLLPGCTHLQPAQPVSLAQHLLAYAWMFRRDHARAEDALKRVRVSPLGAAALSGTTYPLDPAMAAREVGFPEVFANSMDAVSDRDFVMESVFIAAVTMAHLSRLCEELILWANPAFGFVRLPDAFATGSSIMPQKKNPDVAELMRGKTGRVYGALMSLMTLVKGLPLTYNRDLQEDKEPFFDADKTVETSLRLMASMMAEMEFVPERMLALLRKGYLNATELADYLVGKKLPFRDAHHVVGRAVAFAEDQGRPLEELSLQELQSFSPLIQEDVFSVLDYHQAVARRSGRGGTGEAPVQNQISELKAWLTASEGKNGGV
ncbi:argininosuccinate lyase [Desulfonatronum thiosulfatophilum]|uniref:Argininosuccinate lyase n=1 Tax=Desulfonatronum thiosulfatophilum TaxID=617002 RepID=A0A1G6D487_9BACT|nr:argininosuccinate lyase [Desulfonatronum thiosulfatophilum]SDB39957.1 argininosuccinate lyase [Desulfonatronum thiosulfatophilum]